MKRTRKNYFGKRMKNCAIFFFTEKNSVDVFERITQIAYVFISHWVWVVKGLGNPLFILPKWDYFYLFGFDTYFWMLRHCLPDGWAMKGDFIGHMLTHKSKRRWTLSDRADLGLNPVGHSARGNPSSAERG